MAVVKICANKTINEAQMCIDAGADIIGILVGQEHTSNDFVDKHKAKEICDYVAGRCDVSLVTHLTSADEIVERSKYIGNNVIQLHSDIAETEVEKIKTELPNVKLVRLVHMTKEGDVYSDLSAMKFVDYYLMDSFNLATNQVGGTGLTYNWKKAGDIIKTLNKPVFLAGGLNPNNVKQAIADASPFGVDVNSGCKENGSKNADKVKEFVFNAKSSDFKAIIFDFDSTFYSGEDWLMWGDYLKNYVVSTFENAKDILQEYKVENDTSGMIPVEIAIKYNGNAESFYNYQKENIYPLNIDNLRVIDAQGLKELSKKYNLFIVSNSPVNYVHHYLKLFGIDKSLFTAIYDNEFKVEDVSKKLRFLQILKENNLKPNQVCVVGDSFGSDIVPARELNIFAVQVNDVKDTNNVINKLI